MEKTEEMACLERINMNGIKCVHAMREKILEMNKWKYVHVLGTEYTIKIVKISECELLKKNNWCGSCNNLTHEILIGDPSEEEFFGVMSEEEQKLQTKRTLRHEIIHAFFNESGLQDDSSVPESGWATNEEMVDWIAIQSPKLFKAFEEADCL